MTKFYAKVDSYNMTTYDTNTLSVLLKDDTRKTLRIDETLPVKEGEVYHFECEWIDFKGKDQYLVKTYTHITDMNLSLEDEQDAMRAFYHYSPVPTKATKKTIEEALKSIENKTIYEITKHLFEQYEQQFYRYPAATRFHHAYIGGVAHHTATMLKLVDGFVQTYPYLNKDLLNSGIILHDLFKVVELSNHYSPEYTKEGRLIGHLAMGVEYIGKSANELNLYDTEERLMLQHMVLSHHYYGNFGSPKKPNIPEALALHFIDNIDSKFAVLGEALEKIEPGEFTQSLGVLDRERYYKSKLK